MVDFIDIIKAIIEAEEESRKLPKKPERPDES